MNKAKTGLLAIRIAFALWGTKRAIDKAEAQMRELRLKEERLQEEKEKLAKASKTKK